jgi:hypothetical protein
VPPPMDNPLHTSSPMEAEKDFVQSRLRYMMDWTEKTGVKTGGTTAKPTGQECKNAPINFASRTEVGTTYHFHGTHVSVVVFGG